jgi:hypothetical protein
MTRDAMLIFLASLALRAAFIHLHPAIFGGDTILRLANRDRVLLSYQLPVLQAAIYALSRFTESVVAVRYLTALGGAALASGFYLMLRHFVDRRAALCGAALMATSPFLVELSIVPYQEIPMLAALAFAFHFHFAGREGAASAALGIACLTRYEAWCAVPVLILAGRRKIVRAALLYGWAPIVWIVWRGGIAPPGTFVIEWPETWWRFQRYAYLAWIALKNTPPPVLALAGLGVVALRCGPRPNRSRHLAAFLALFLVSILFSAHGVLPDPERYVASREAAIPIAAGVFLAALAVARRPRPGLALAIAGVVWGIADAHRFLVRDTSLPELRLSVALARYLEGNLAPGEKAAVLARNVEPRMYLAKVERRQGEEGLRRAREIMASGDMSPPDYQRTLVHSRLGRGRLLSGRDASAALVAVWHDYAGDAVEGEELAVLREGSAWIRVLRPVGR